MLKSKKFKILLFLISVASIVFFVCLSINLIYAKFTTNATGYLSFGVAKPICKVFMNETIYISNYSYVQPTDFSVCNYDEYGNISEVALKYFITITTNQTNAPLNYSLFRIQDNGSEEKIDINVSNGVIKTINEVTMPGNSENVHNYRLKVDYKSNSKVDLSSDFAVHITIDSQQINPSN